MRNFAVLLIILWVVSISQAVMLADFETGLDGFSAINSPLATLTNPTEPAGAITSGTHCLRIDTAGTNYWSLLWTPSSVPQSLGVLKFDITYFAADWPTQPWTMFPDKLALNIDYSWDEVQLNDTNWTWRDTGEPAPASWGAWDGDAAKTCTVDLSNFSVEGATTFTITISINVNQNVAGTFYFDNMRWEDRPNNPNPANGGLGGLTTDLSWTNATDSVSSVTVWFGIPPEPNEADPNTILGLDTYKTLLNQVYTEAYPGATSTCPNANIGTLTDGQEYTWCVETEPNNIPVPFWTFTATPNLAPTADAGADQYIYTYADVNDIQITLDGSASSDDGLIAPLTYAWTQTEGPAATIDTPDAVSTTVTLNGGLANNTEAGSADPYVFQLVVDDGQVTDSDTVSVFVNSNSCTASIEAGGYYFYGDIAGPDGAGDEFRDCKVDLYDFTELALNWLGCSNIFEACN